MNKWLILIFLNNILLKKKTLKLLLVHYIYISYNLQKQLVLYSNIGVLKTILHYPGHDDVPISISMSTRGVQTLRCSETAYLIK